MVNHPNRKKKRAVFPDLTLQNAAAAADVSCKLLWEITGPSLTNVAHLSCYALGQSLVIVETFIDGGWQAFTPNASNRIDDTIQDVFNRCKVPAPGSSYGNEANKQA